MATDAPNSTDGIDGASTGPESKGQATQTSQSLTPDQRRTVIYVVAAAACLGITGIFEWSSRPAPIEEFGRVGEEFYAEFEDPTLATSLEVYVFDAEKVQPFEFRVQKLANGRWVIPSHHQYPADAEDQLAKTAASVIGIKRGAMVTRWPADHAQFGVVNPRQDSLNVGDVEGVGKRIILSGEDETVLADYIIGDQADDESGQYYVRSPEEDEVYLTSLEIDISTKFTDWIKTDLLDVNNWDMTEVTVNKYSFEELQGSVSQREVSTFRRDTSSDPWKLTGLDEATEQIVEDAISETVNTIADLEVVGVRPKQEGLTPDLKLDRAALKSQRDLDRLQSDLLTRGFLLQPGEDGDQENLKLMAREGELYAATTEGLLYRMYFGRAFAGSQEELEIGLTSGSEEDSGDGDKEDQDASNGEAAEAASGDSGNPGRYVFVQVEFHEQYLGEPPVKPTEPVMPAELDAAVAPDAAAAETAGESNEVADDTDTDEEAADPLAAVRAQYEEAQQQYESDLRDFETKSEERDVKVTDGQKKAADLNRRFADWYYVISGDSFDKLRLSRADLVEAKEDDEAGEEGDGAVPSFPPFGEGTFPPTAPSSVVPSSIAPASTVPSSPSSIAPSSTIPAEPPSSTESPTEESPSEESPTEESPAVESPTEETPAAESPTGETPPAESPTASPPSATPDPDQ